MDGYIFRFFQCFVSNRSKFCLFRVPKVGFLCLTLPYPPFQQIFDLPGRFQDTVIRNS